MTTRTFAEILDRVTFDFFNIPSTEYSQILVSLEQA
jgi:hypothetical protein